MAEAVESLEPEQEPNHSVPSTPANRVLTPELVQQGDVENGLLCVDWSNAHEFDQDEFIDYEYKILHRYQFANGNQANLQNSNSTNEANPNHSANVNDSNHPNYPHNEWQTTEKVPVYFDPDGRFHLKLPLFLQPYHFEYRLQVIIWRMIGHDPENPDDVGPLNEDVEMQWEITGETTSDIYSTEVPSVLIDHKKSYQKGDVVSWFDQETSTFSDGVIVEVAEDTLKLKPDSPFYHNHSDSSSEDEEETVVIPTSQVVLEEVPNENIIDVTLRGAAELALVLRTDDEESHSIYYALRQVSKTFVREFLIPDLMDSIIDYEVCIDCTFAHFIQK